MLIKECFVSIIKSRKRFISLLLIVLLGVGFYVGIKAASPDMRDTLNVYYEENNMHDIEIVSTLGIRDKDITALKEAGYSLMPGYSFDTIIQKEEEYAVKVLSYDKDSTMEVPIVKEGRLPQNNRECVLEKNHYTKDYQIGDTITINNDNVKEKEETIVGFIESPNYISSERGPTTLLSGTIHYYLYMPISNFTSAYYTTAYIKLRDSRDVFSKEYKTMIAEKTKDLETITKQLASNRTKELKEEATNSLNDAKAKYEQEVNNAQVHLQNPMVPLETKQKIQKQLQEALLKIEKAEQQIAEIEDAEWYILDLESNPGFYQYEKDAERIANIAKVFPAVFFIVAILICLTTMTRMVEEERSQIGTLKSLGYGDGAIMFKYSLYSLLATLLGSFIGIVIGLRFLPEIIFNMYQMMYTIPNFQNNFNIVLAVQGTTVATLCTLGATLYACKKTLKEVPAELLRPKAPKSGKRVLLERIPFIWKHLKFSEKVTIRNVFRYKKKFLMTIIGISGCTGLILAGFGVKDCITKMVPNQYEKIFQYKASIALKEDSTQEQRNTAMEAILKMPEIKGTLKVEQESINLVSENTNQTIQMTVPLGDIEDFILLRNRKTKEKYELKEEVIITEKIAKLLNLKVGDTIIFKTNTNQYEKKIGAITENYLYHYIYMNQDNYQASSYNTILLKTNEMSEKEEKEFANKLKEIQAIASVSFNSSTRTVFDSTMQNFSYVVLVLIVSAGLLAFVVLYNLESVNISERIREIASIKVLGFYDKEVYHYITRETFILSTIGMILGIFVGQILTTYIMKTCELDMFMFNPIITWPSYIYALGITFVFMILVSITTYFVLKKIDMIESLKSVE